ncbi:MAG: cytochrome c maturation protein CcmE [Alphaproteobacteria bacterium]|nr:cytochrome c maturation protein CcmE [Alphaproteobacteria bacterium]
MKPKRRRLLFVVTGMAMLAIAVGLVLAAFEDNLVFFNSPTDVVEKKVAPNVRIRLGGLVEQDSVLKMGTTTTFRVTDTRHSVAVRYTGLLPDLFREGQGVVTEGRLGEDGVFLASTVLAKHDENYMPPEVADALKKSGHWMGEAAK